MSHPATEPTLISPTPGSPSLVEVLRRLDERPVACGEVSRLGELMARIERRRRLLSAS